MDMFSYFLAILSEIEDHRRAEGKLYTLSHILLFSILAIASGANSYRGVHTFIKTHLSALNAAFGLSWQKAPVHSAIRYILKGLDPEAIELAFRKHAAILEEGKASRQSPDGEKDSAQGGVIAIDGKTLKHSFDNLKDRKAAQILNAFSTQTALILAHVEIDDKSNEIPAAQKLLSELNLTGRVVTLDAMHCQKKRFRRPSTQTLN
jgi:hypothetical protein